MHNDAAGWLVRKLGEYDVLTEAEAEVLERVVEHEHDVAKGVDIVVEGSRPGHSTLLVHGFCARYTLLPDGKRQITAIHIPGDFVDLHSFLMKTMDHGVLTLTACRIAEVRHERLKIITDQFPHLTRLLWLNTLIDAAIHRQWLVAMGAQDAVGQFAHFTCEMYVRLDAVGLAKDQSFELPMTQTDIGETLGLSSVHTNRILQLLRRQNLLTLRGPKVEILDWPGLQDLAMFNPAYLSIRQEPR